VVDADSMERRQFVALTGLTLTAVAHQWLFDPARVAASVMGKRVNHALVNDLDEWPRHDAGWTTPSAAALYSPQSGRTYA
jgi:hypothetical protein